MKHRFPAECRLMLPLDFWPYTTKCPRTAVAMVTVFGEDMPVCQEHLLMIKEQQEQEHESIVCPRCGMRSHNPHDVREGYCGNCHEYTSRKDTNQE